jgi:septum formation protein
LDLLRQIGIEPDAVVPADIDETPRPRELPPAYAKRVAAEKAYAVARAHPCAFVLAADTVVALGRRILPKAEDEATARHCLQLLSGRRHRVLGAVALLAPRSESSSGGDPDRRLLERLVVSQVAVKRLSAEETAAYLASGEWHGKAGGYAIQGLAAGFIPKIIGSYSNIVGLPLMETRLLLAGAGWRGATASPS